MVRTSPCHGVHLQAGSTPVIAAEFRDQEMDVASHQKKIEEKLCKDYVNQKGPEDKAAASSGFQPEETGSIPVGITRTAGKTALLGRSTGETKHSCKMF
jgi:hypothetical protein